MIGLFMSHRVSFCNSINSIPGCRLCFLFQQEQANIEIVKITKHIIPFNLGLENGAERCLAFEFVETSLHVADGIPHGEPVSACDAADGC